MAQDNRPPQEHEFTEELAFSGLEQEHLQWRDLRRVRLRVSADLGACPMTVREVLALQRGSIVPLSKLAGETADLYLNEVPLGKGEVVVLGDTLHVRIAEVAGATELDLAEYE
ncbi:MAG: FliM/FliN family flagellar motor switch protein [Candidatus Hydrogenedentes bacterium]|nr:FliM/FliN family flagellar motor switch protein [Candidatus Hydrogenedentota bacterium]